MARSLRRAATSLGRPRFRDVIAGLVTGLFSIPEGMAYASIGGFNPVAGLYSGVVSTIVGSMFARTVLMVTTLTSALALTSQSVLNAAGLDPTDPSNIAALVIVAGAIMLLFGLLRFGAMMNFVSNAVMTGFTTGIALQIIAGVIHDSTGYRPDSHNTIGKFVDAFAHIGSWQLAPCLVALGTVAVWAVFHFIKPLEAFATLIALVVVTVVVTVIGVEVETVGDIASIPNALPPLTMPNFAAMTELLAGGLAVALVGLAQAAGISAAVPNPDRSRPSTNGDFIAQGTANLAGGFFGALPTGGSLSRTGVAVSAGAQTRWAGIFAGLWLAALVVVAGSLAELIPMPVIGGLILVIGAELVAGRWADILLVLRTAPLSAVAMVVTFLATTQLPLHTAILIGAITSLVLYCVKASQAAGLEALVRADDGGWLIAPVPEKVESDAVTVLQYSGVGLFAEVPRIDEEWPRVADSHRAVVVLSMRTLPDVPSTKVIKSLRRWAQDLRDNGGRLIIAGATPATKKVLEAGGLGNVLGDDGIVPASDRVFGPVEEAVRRGERWIAGEGDGRG
ncbi:SulP family inorganic anion transporter [Mycolicibacterium celeriflavum]|uniref:Sodium-independent anion transporter n=1 Tax=Mycolicibacterium celeriflavum TaxID=1249101 RepID=A0A1X0BVZ0_MYCCF|nr:SulP family inorganic anion transporter [Mycolicibacterium celeriflavum]ORA48392.1 transporter [Mycolicibacterium celeriflavum]BBY46111.1 sodium-independent anion transporter [Mycolicibacterium celeriflavum]